MMSHDYCAECGALLSDREERVELTCWRCIFQRDWAHVTAHPAQRREAQQQQQQQRRQTAQQTKEA